MPVKRRRGKRRLSRAAELEAWEVVFQTGRDFFGDLEDIGVEDTPEARRDAWRRLGADFLASAAADPWALREYGEPNAS